MTRDRAYGMHKATPEEQAQALDLWARYLGAATGTSVERQTLDEARELYLTVLQREPQAAALTGPPIAAAETLKQIALALNSLVLMSIAKGRNADVPVEDRITDVDLDSQEQKILALVQAALTGPPSPADLTEWAQHKADCEVIRPRQFHGVTLGEGGRCTCGLRDALYAQPPVTAPAPSLDTLRRCGRCKSADLLFDGKGYKCVACSAYNEVTAPALTCQECDGDGTVVSVVDADGSEGLVPCGSCAVPDGVSSSPLRDAVTAPADESSYPKDWVPEGLCTACSTEPCAMHAPSTAPAAMPTIEAGDIVDLDGFNLRPVLPKSVRVLQGNDGVRAIFRVIWRRPAPAPTEGT